MMEFDEIVVKESPGLCRCCLSEGCYKDLSTEYSWMSETEIYADMLLECFDISITQHNDGPNGPNRLICEVCITRLRDACNFKKQVVDSEKKFVDMIGRGEFRPKVMIYQAPMKSEAIVEETLAEDVEVEYLDEDLDFGDDVPLSETIAQEASASEDMTIASLKVKGKRGRPKKTATVIKSEKKAKTAKLEDKPRTSKAVSKGDVSQTTQESDAIRRRRNLAALFNNTTMLPFKWQTKYTCFFCKEKLDEYDKFLAHNKSHDLCSVNTPALKTVNKTIMLDVSYISCKICKEPFDNMDSIVFHLIRKHNIEYDKDIQMSLTPYRLVDLKCLICAEKCSYFQNLAKHNREHTRKTDVNIKSLAGTKDLGKLYRCEKCNRIFKNMFLLKRHGIEKHKQMQLNTHRPDIINRSYNKQVRENIACILKMTTALPFQYYQHTLMCLYCSEGFSLHTDFRNHVQKEHKKALNIDLSKVVEGKAFKLDISDLTCRICLETFDALDDIINHLIYKHESSYDKKITNVLQPFKLADDLTCVICKKQFTYFKILLQHMNKAHNDKTILCSHCGETFTKQIHLHRHMNAVHIEKNTIKCKDCNQTFKTDHKLKSHRAVAHDAAFSCSKCGEKFLTHYERAKHVLEVHKIGHACPKCDKMFVKNSFMMNHLQRFHLKEKKLQCPVCQMKFFNVAMLKNHMIKHTGERKYKCDVCNKTYLWKKNLKAHVDSVHSSVRQQKEKRKTE